MNLDKSAIVGCVLYKSVRVKMILEIKVFLNGMPIRMEPVDGGDYDDSDEKNDSNNVLITNQPVKELNIYCQIIALFLIIQIFYKNRRILYLVQIKFLNAINIRQTPFSRADRICGLKNKNINMSEDSREVL